MVAENVRSRKITQLQYDIFSLTTPLTIPLFHWTILIHEWKCSPLLQPFGLRSSLSSWAPGYVSCPIPRQNLQRVSRLVLRLIFRFRWFHFWILRLWILRCRWCDCENLVQICHDHEYVSSVGETRPRGTCAHSANGVAIVCCILTQRCDLTSAIKPCGIRKSD